jgi:hypothetical protein
VQEDPLSPLRELAIGWFDSATETAADAAHKLQMAGFLAGQRPDDWGSDGAIMREYSVSQRIPQPLYVP